MEQREELSREEKKQVTVLESQSGPRGSRKSTSVINWNRSKKQLGFVFKRLI